VLVIISWCKPKLYSNSNGAYRCTDGLQGVWKVDVREERRTGFSAQPGAFTLCPITAPKHGSSAVENLKFKWLAAMLLHLYNTGHKVFKIDKDRPERFKQGMSEIEIKLD
jgi:hypothetical protein